MGLLLLVQQTSDSHSRKSTWWVVLDPKTEVAKWNSAIIHFIIYTCASPTVTCKNASENSLLWLCINMLLTWCWQPPVCRLLLAPNHSTGLWRLYKTCTWQTHKHSNPHHMTYWSIVCVFLDVCQMCDDFMCEHQTYFLHLPCLSQRDSGTFTTQEVKATHKAWLLLSICMPMMRLSSTPSILHLEKSG